MGLIGILLDWVKRDRSGAQYAEATFDPGAGKNATGVQFGPAGDHARPLPGDYIAAVETAGAGRVIVIGYSDPNNAQDLEPGERRIYARDSSGAVVVDLFLRADGSATLGNSKGSIKLNADGSFDINGAKITADGEIINKRGINLSTHRHGGVTTGQGVTTGAQ